MTEEKKSQILYLDNKDIELLHGILAEKAKKAGEPIPAFSLANHSAINSLLDAPQMSFFGVEAYPSIAEKAAIIFYSINKNQIFGNGNKRMSTLCLLVFLIINDYILDVDPDELTAKALWLANTKSQDFQDIKKELVGWIDKNIHKKENEESL